MKFVAAIIGNSQMLRVYRLLNRISTAIEVSLAMVPSWIQILVRRKKRVSLSYKLIILLITELYSELCTIDVDLSHLWNTSSVQTLSKGSGVYYYKVSYELIMLFGGTEIEAQLCWKENVRFSVSFFCWKNCSLCWGLTISIIYF